MQGHYAWTRENLLHNIEISLRRMHTDSIDVWQLHNPTVEQVEAGDLVRVMEEVKAAGKVRFLGISSTLPHISTFISWGVFDTFQIPYSALERTHESAMWGREGEILRCPWHGWEFDILSGRSIFNPHRMRVRTYEVTVEPDEDLVIETYPVTVEDGVIVLHI